MKRKLRSNIASNLNNYQLQLSLNTLKKDLQKKYKSGLQNKLNTSFLKDRVHQIRKKNLSKLPLLLEQLEENCTKNKIQVVWADNTQKANNIIFDLLCNNNIKKVLTAKSEICRELRLKNFLKQKENNIIEYINCDFEEYITQLRGEEPISYKIAAAHLSQNEIKKTFIKKFPKLFKNLAFKDITIDHIVKKFREICNNTLTQPKTAGITDINFAVAQNGSLVSLEDSGNIRQLGILPRIHIALMTINQVVENLEELATMINALSLNSTGKEITNYINITNTPANDYDLEGPKKVYLIILNNKRSSLLKDPLLAETLMCINCGACSIYNSSWYIGDNTHQTTIPAPIGQILTAQIDDNNKNILFIPTNNYYDDICPAKIQISKILLTLRRKNFSKTPFTEKVFWFCYGFIATTPFLFRVLKFCLRARFLFLLFPFGRTWLKYHKMAPTNHSK